MKLESFARRTGLAVLLCLGMAGSVSAREDLQRQEEPRFISQAVREVEIVKDGETVLEIAYQPKENKESYAYWTMSVPYESMVTLDTEKMYNLFGMLAELDFSDDAAAKETQAEQAEQETSIRIAYLEGQEEGQSGQTQPDTELKLFIRKQPEGYTGFLEGFENRVFNLDREIMDAVLAVEPYQLILKITHLVNIQVVSELEVSDGVNTLLLKKTGEEFFVENESVEEDVFNQTYMKFMSVLITGELPEDYVLEEDRQALLTLDYTYAEGEKKEIVQYFPYDEVSCSVSVNGKEFFLVDKAEVEALICLLK